MAPDLPVFRASAPEGDPLEALVEHAWERLVGGFTDGDFVDGISVDLPARVEGAKAAFVAAFRRSLRRPELTEEEAGVVARIADGGPSREFDQLLTLRVQHALRRACEESGIVDREVAEELAARTVVARGDGERTVPPTASRDAEPSALDQLAQTIDYERRALPEERPFVLTNRGGEVELERTKEAHLKAGGVSDSGSLDVIEMTAALEELEAHVLEVAPVEAKAALSALARGDDLIGETLNGKYLVTGRLGKGGFGTVYQATDLGFAEELGETSGARVAIKVLNASVQRDRKAIKRFLEEANRLTLLNHPNIVQWITFDKTPEGIHFFVMEFLEGRELAEILSVEKQMDPMRVAALLVDVLAALERAHGSTEVGALLHLDLKPQNIFVLGAAEVGAETAKVIDFGIGQNVGNELADVGAISLEDDVPLSERALERTFFTQGDPAPQRGRTTASTTFSTLDGQVRRARGGTVLYSSPEQCKHLRKDADIEHLDGRSDLYSLGVVGFKALTGTYPFARKATSLREAYEQHLHETPRRVRDVRPKVPRRIAAVIDRCLEKDRSRRFASARDARQALVRAMQPLISRSFLIGAPIMLMPLVGLGLHWLFKAPEYEQINTAQVLRTPSRAGDGETAARSLASFWGSTPLQLASDNVGPAVRLAFEDGVAPSGSPRLHLGEEPLDPEAPAFGRVVLREDADGQISFHSLLDEPTPATPVFVRWEDSLLVTPPFRIATLGPLPPMGVSVSLGTGEGATALSLGGEPSPIWSETEQELVFDLTGVTRESLVSGTLREVGSGDAYGLTLAEDGVGLRGSIEASRLWPAGAEGSTADRTLRMSVLDRAGRFVEVGGEIQLRLTRIPTAIEPGSVRLVRYGIDPDAPLVSTPLYPDGHPEGHDQRVAITGAVTRMLIRGRVSPGAGRRAQVRLSGSFGSSIATVEDAEFSFPVPLRELLGDEGGARARVDGVARTLSLRLAVVDAGILPPGEGAGEPFSSALTLVPQEPVELVLEVDRGQPQRIEAGAVAFLRPGPARLQLPPVEADVVFGLFERTQGSGEAGDGSSARLGRLLGFAAGDELTLEAAASASVELLMFEAASIDGGVSLSDGLAALDPRSSLASTRFELRVLRKLSVERIGFATGLEPRIESSVLREADLPALEIEIEEPDSLQRVLMTLRRNGTVILDRQPDTAELLPERTGDLWRVPPGEWARGLLGRRGWRDGLYELEVSLEDCAGHRTEPSIVARFSIAAEPPRVEGATLEAGGFERLVVQMKVTDDNGIVWEPSATFEIDGDVWPMRLLTDRPAGSEGEPVRSAVLRFELPLERAMSRRSGTVTVEVREAPAPGGVNGEGSITAWSESLDLGRVRESLPLRIERDELRGASPMVLVRGPADPGGYVFAEGGAAPGGALRARFSDSGVPYLESDRPYRNYLAQAATFFPTLRPIRVESDALLDYYLDETEVTEAQFLRFVVAQDGYRDVKNWPLLRRLGSAPEVAATLGRAGAWEERLLASASRETRPVHDVLWEEAAAYAAWVGKRLPTLLEWEYAVRGEGGRLFAVPDGAPGDPRAFLSQDGALAAVSLDAHRSAEGFFHLCGNVAEWTQTSYWKSQPTLPFEASDAEFCAGHVNGGTTLDALAESFIGNRTDLYGRDGPLFFVAGAGWANGRGSFAAFDLPMAPHDFRVVDRLPLGPRWKALPGAPRVGFRCALSVSGI